MSNKPKEPFLSPERHETVRKEIISALEHHTLSAKEISAIVKISEKDVYEHLEHIQKTISRGKHRFVVIPSECVKCGFVFKKRERLTKPGKCPVCRSESIQPPLFSIKKD